MSAPLSSSRSQSTPNGATKAIRSSNSNATSSSLSTMTISPTPNSNSAAINSITVAQSPSSNSVSSNIPKDSSSNLLSPSEERDLETLWSTTDIDVTDIDELSTRLTQQLAGLEVDNIEGIIESETSVADIINLMNDASEELSEVSEWLQTYNLQLTHMRQYIEHIESKNTKMEIITNNERALLAELQHISLLDIPEQLKLVLIKGDLKSAQGLSNATKASAILAEAIKASMKPELEDLLAIREQRVIIEQLRVLFSKRLTSRFVELFEESAEELKGSESNAGDWMEHEELHSKLSSYKGLMHWLVDIDPTQYQSLMKSYTKSFRPVYKKEMKLFFAELNKCVIKEQHDQKAFFTTTNKGIEDLQKQSAPSPVVSSSKGKRRTIVKAFGFGIRTVDEVVMAEQRFLCEFFKLKKYDKPDPSINRSEVDIILEELFEGVVSFFNEMVDWADKMDQFYPLEILVEIDQSGSTHEEGADYSSYLVGILFEIQMSVKVVFNRFLDSQVESIKGTQATIKRCGILPYITKFPLFVDRIEDMRKGKTGRNALTSVIDTAYHKVVMCLFSWLEGLGASEHQKFRYIVRLENYHHFSSEVSLRKVASLDTYVMSSYEHFKENTRNYAQYLINRQFKSLVEFFKEMDTLLQTLPPGDIQYQSSHSKQTLSKLIDRTGASAIERGFSKGLKNIIKNLSAGEGLVGDVWNELQDLFLNQYIHYEELVSKCYSTQKLSLAVPSRELTNVFRSVEVKTMKR